MLPRAGPGSGLVGQTLHISAHGPWLVNWGLKFAYICAAGSHIYPCPQADDRLLLISEPAPGGGSAPRALALARQFGEAAAGASTRGADLGVTHLRLPAAYVAANWPLMRAALSADGMDIAVAGRAGLALFSRRSARWRLFGDVSQERELAVQVC